MIEMLGVNSYAPDACVQTFDLTVFFVGHFGHLASVIPPDIFRLRKALAIR